MLDSLIANEKYHYLEPHHGKKYIDTLWDIGNAVYEHRLIRMRYRKLAETDKVLRIIKPLALMFSEYYFYLIAYKCTCNEMPDVSEHSDVTIYRIDRIAEYQILNEHFTIPYAERFEEGEFRKRVQFMFGGKLKKIKFLYKGLSIEAVLDRLPTAEIVKQDENGWLITAEVYGDGVDMWLRSQGKYVEMIN